MKKKLLLLLIMLIPFFINAKEIKIEWMRNNVGYPYYDYPMAELNDGGTVIVMNSDSNLNGVELKGKKDAVLIKYDISGNLIWKTNWGGSEADGIESIIATPDGGFAALGHTNSNDIPGIEYKGNQDGVLIKYDKNGNIEWQKGFGDEYVEYISELLLTNDGNFVTVGVHSDLNDENRMEPYDILITTFDKNGNILLEKKYGGSEGDDPSKIFLTKNNELIVFFNSTSTDLPGTEHKNFQDTYMMKISASGEIIWITNFGGNGYDSVEIVKETDNAFIIISCSNSSDIPGTTYIGGIEALITKIDKNGNIIWQRIWGGTGNDYIWDISELYDGNYIMVGNSYSTDENKMNNNGSADAFLIKYDKNGNLLWQKNWGGSDFDNFQNVIVNNNILVAGTTKSTDIEGLNLYGSTDIILLEYDLNGNIQQIINVGGSKDETIAGLTKGAKDDYYLRIHSKSTDIANIENKSGNDSLLIKFNLNYNIDLNENISYGTATAVQQGSKGIVTSTPDKGYEVDQIIIKDSEGNILDVETTKLEDGTYSFPLYTDVSVEVTFKEKVANPKTGLLDYGAILSLFILLPILALVYICRYNQKYGL